MWNLGLFRLLALDRTIWKVKIHVVGTNDLLLLYAFVLLNVHIIKILKGIYIYSFMFFFKI